MTYFMDSFTDTNGGRRKIVARFTQIHFDEFDVIVDSWNKIAGYVRYKTLPELDVLNQQFK